MAPRKETERHGEGIMAKNTNKKDWSAIVWALGWMLSLVHAIKDGADRLELPFAAFARLTSERGARVVERILEVIREDYRRELAVRVEALKVNVVLTASLKAPATLLLPTIASLRRIFSGGVHQLYATVNFMPIDALRLARAKRGRLVMVHMGCRSKGSEVLAEMAFRRLRPLHPVELIELWERVPDLGEDCCVLVALGAVAFPDGCGCRVMEIYGANGKKCLCLADPEQVRDEETCFPAMSMEEDEGS